MKRIQICALVICALAICNLTVRPCVGADQEYMQYFPYSRNPGKLWQQAMSPQSGAPCFIINNRPVFLQPEHHRPFSLKPAKAMSDAELNREIDSHRAEANPEIAEVILQHAVKTAKANASLHPADVIDCLMNLGGFYFQQCNYGASEEVINEALMRQCLRSGFDSVEAADIGDLLALCQRAEHKYNRAEELYRKSLAVRSSVYGENHRLVAVSHMNLAMVYSDSGRPGQMEEKIKAAEIIGNTAYIDAHLSSAPIPISTWQLNKPAGGGELPSMIAFADDVMLKNAIPEDMEPAYSATGARLFGHWGIATDSATADWWRRREHHTTLIKRKSAEAQANKSSHLGNVAIYLCPAEKAQSILDQISSYATAHKLDPLEAGKKWPADGDEAMVLLESMNACANSARFDQIRTGDSGNFDFLEVPAGDYVLYASLVTKSGVYFWLSHSISLKPGRPAVYDFDSLASGRKLWPLAEKGGE